LALLVTGELPQSEFFDAFAAAECATESISTYAFGNTRVLLFLAHHHVVGMNFDSGFCVLATTDGITQRIDIASAGGTRAIWESDPGPMEQDLVSQSVYSELFQRAKKLGFRVQAIGRIPTNLSYRDSNALVQP
jgi:hypothetical protein